MAGLSLGYIKVRKTAKIRKRCNQVPYLTQDTTWESKSDKWVSCTRSIIQSLTLEADSEIRLCKKPNVIYTVV